MVDEMYEVSCIMATWGLCGIAAQRDPDEELTEEEAMHLYPVLLAFQQAVGDDTDDSSDFRVDDDLY